MSSVFIIQNQEALFLSRQKEWVADGKQDVLFKTPHHDLALNELFELTAKHPELRAAVIEAQTNNRGLPLIDNLEPPISPKGELLQPMAAAVDPDIQKSQTTQP